MAVPVQNSACETATTPKPMTTEATIMPMTVNHTVQVVPPGPSR